ncbi:MAG: YlqD family protein [Desulfotomaculales bacterium]
MESLTITRPVLVKVRVTEGYKKALSAEVQEAVARLEKKLLHMDFQFRRVLADLEKNSPREVPEARRQFEAERRKTLEAKQKLLEKLKEIGAFVPGEEVVDGEVESMFEVRGGDDWGRVMGVEVVLEDGRVAAIREGRSTASAGGEEEGGGKGGGAESAGG